MALFILNAIASFILLILLVGGFFVHYRKKIPSKVVHWFSLLSVIYGALLLFFILWENNTLMFDTYDAYFLLSLVACVQTLILFKVVSFFTYRKRFWYLLLIYLLLAIVFFVSPSSVAVLLFAVSYALFLYLSFFFVIFSTASRRSGYAGILYSSVSLLFSFLLFYSIGNLLVFSLVSQLLLAIFAYYFMRDVRRYPVFLHKTSPNQEIPHILLFIKYFIFIIVVTNIALVSTIAVHELSHVLTSRMYGCTSRSIFYEEGVYPYSEILCNDLTGKLPIVLSGPLAPILIGLLLILVGGAFIRSIGLLVIGFNLLASYKDLGEAGVGESLIFASTVAGIIILFAGIVVLAHYRIHTHPDMV